MKLFIFGSTGNLVIKRVLPALQNIKNVEIYALGRKNLDSESYRNLACVKCDEKFRKRINYIKVEFNESLANQLGKIFDKTNTNLIFISLPPSLILTILNSMVELKKRKYKVRILIEKPFGSSLEDAKILKQLIEKNDMHEEIFLSDHYLFKKNILKLSRINFKKLRIVSIEKVGVEGRKIYDKIGALRDMIQSHFFNIAFKISGSFDNIKILEYKRGQYREYEQEVSKSETETFVDIQLLSGDKTYEFITGKGFDKKSSFIEIDGRRMGMESGENAYIELFKEFIANKGDNFPTIDNAVTAWKIIELVEEKKPKLEYYPKGMGYEQDKKIKE